MLLYKLRIDLGGRNIAVPHHFLNGVEICTVFQQVRGKAVPQCVGRDVFIDMRLFLIAFHDFPKALTAHAIPVDVDKQRLLVHVGNHLRTNILNVNS